mmetsp:Transcript_20737/g.42161  ORF Transcript_20737/g.42161 Transcript_20737/m.42161 type:complete len:205 (+) Transcript_20737:171-785(+)|eukprot:CAMPEP_0181310276 /NCGR_PEP_ID=MMETSP1101-20121128/12497_1 /TAXON_ID=46948 /ORGANISM="Rhodomonas abbreviata, Strain Caron Lab Isolate" /LENGTH=204 /DNA_ID=CAMNT_0023416889 /DNA_START=152 /DNA_END=766 /DNA_ORIENTATION=-
MTVASFLVQPSVVSTDIAARAQYNRQIGACMHMDGSDLSCESFSAWLRMARLLCASTGNVKIVNPDPEGERHRQNRCLRVWLREESPLSEIWSDEHYESDLLERVAQIQREEQEKNSFQIEELHEDEEFHEDLISFPKECDLYGDEELKFPVLRGHSCPVGYEMLCLQREIEIKKEKGMRNGRGRVNSCSECDPVSERDSECVR